MASIDAQIAEYVTQVLAAADLGVDIQQIEETNRASLLGPFGTAVRTYLPEYALEQSDMARISVLSFNRTQNQFTRATMQEDYLVDVIVHQRVNDDTMLAKNATPDDVRTREEVWRDNVTVYGDRTTQLAENVHTTFEKKANRNCTYITPNVGECGRAVWLQAMREGTYQRAEVEQMHVIFSVVRNLWRTYRDVAA